MSRSPQKYRSASVVFCALALLLLPSFGSPLSAQQDFLRGDYNGNGVVEVIADFYYFQGNWDHATGTFTATTCPDAVDFNDDGVIDINEGNRLYFEWWNFENSVPSSPGVLVCGPDPTADPLDCVATSCTPPPAPPVLPASSLTIGSMNAVALDVIEVPITLVHSEPLLGFSFAVCHDPTKLEILSLGLGADLPLHILGVNVGHHIYPGGGFDFGYIRDTSFSVILPATRDVVRPRYRCLAEGQATLETCTTIGKIPLPPRGVVSDFTEREIPTVPGLIDIAAAPLTNDDCSSPISIAVGSRVFSSLDATPDGPNLAGACTPTADLGTDVWFSYSVGCDGLVALAVESTEFSPQIAVYSSTSCPASVANLLGCADSTSSPNPDEAFLELNGQLGQVFLVQVGSGGGATGTGSISVTCTQPPTFVSPHDLVAPTPTVGDRFGNRLAMSGATLVVSEHDDDSAVSQGGAVHVYDKEASGWNLSATILRNPPLADGQFGYTVDVDGDLMVVGEQIQFFETSVYTFERNGSVWAEEDTIPANATSFPSPSFGSALSLCGNRVAVGGTQQHAVATFLRTGAGWVLEQEITSPDAGEVQFGWSVQLEGTRLLIADPSWGGSARGRCYVYDFDGSSWILSGTLIASDGEDLDSFGTSIALAGDLAFVAAGGHDGACPGSVGFTCESGAVYAFELVNGTWTEITKIEAELPIPLDFFGSAAIQAQPNGDLVVSSSDSSSGTGAVHYFERLGATWVPIQVIRPQIPDPDAGFGFELAWSAAGLAVGSPNGFPPTGPGAVTVYEDMSAVSLGEDFVRADCNQDGTQNIADAVFALSFLFPPASGPPSVNCLDSCDGNDDGGLNIADAITILGSLFGASPTMIPGPNSCGTDPTADSLGCAISGGACP